MSIPETTPLPDGSDAPDNPLAEPTPAPALTPVPTRSGAEPRFPAITTDTYVRLVEYALLQAVVPFADLEVPSPAIPGIVAQVGTRFHVTVWECTPVRFGWKRAIVSTYPCSPPNP